MCEFGSQELGVRSQKPEFRIQESEVRSQDSGFRSQEPESRRTRIDFLIPNP
ncbi:hypothetical protein [Mastigocoleus testarum]|uniref:hypothetical protein n=1 Tax=Mastigocoleus testarum TaxID=996925 RepID=UPI0013799C7A|nr:hypothetical protein [Mastigocoleus testarum]